MKNFTNVPFAYIQLLFIILTVFISSANGQIPNSNIVQNPEEFQWTFHPVTANNPEAYYSGTLEAGKATFVINGETFTTRAYRQQGSEYSIPGPTIKVVPGNKYILSFHNTLPYEPLSMDHNVFKDPNVCNVHTHGLHISGKSPGDDVSRAFEGGRGGDYVWDIPADHMGGTYWYHAHHHGSSFLQVSGGMYGMLIVDDSADGIPANVAAMEEKEIVFGFLDPSAAGSGGDVIMGGTLSQTMTTNGLVGGNIIMPSNTWQHWRVMLADRSAMKKTITFGPECEVMLLARDGVWRTSAPKELASNTIELTGASRADFAIRTTGNSSVAVNGNILANIYTDGESDLTVHPFDTDGVSTWSAIRPKYLRDLSNEANVHSESISMGARTINGSKFDHHNANLTLQADMVQEWSLSGTTNHPFHIHIYHVQAMETDGDFEAGEYYDVVSTAIPVRFDLNQETSSVFSGPTIFHCHVLSHEDRGAMGWLNVIGGIGAPSFPEDGDMAQPYSEYYIIGVPQTAPQSPSDLTAVATSSSSVILSWIDNADNEEGFIIERSLDGINFEVINTLSADNQSFTDNGLSASTTYYYQVAAFNSFGVSDFSIFASATTLNASTQDLYFHVENNSISRQTLGGNRVFAVATVTISDEFGTPVSGVLVSGSFSGPTNTDDSGLTDANGQVSLSSKAIKNPSGNWCFEVTNAELAGAIYDASANSLTIVCEGSNQKNMATEDSGDFISAGISVYPNPVSKRASLNIDLLEETHVTFEVYNLFGEKVDIIESRVYSAGSQTIDWNVENMSNGTYIIFIKANNSIQSQKILIID